MDWKERILFPILGPILKAALWPISRMRLPQVKGTLSIKGLEAPVEVLRDKWGVAHIYAQKCQGCAFCPGFCACPGTSLADGFHPQGGVRAFVRGAR